MDFQEEAVGGGAVIVSPLDLPNSNHMAVKVKLSHRLIFGLSGSKWIAMVKRVFGYLCQDGRSLSVRGQGEMVYVFTKRWQPFPNASDASETNSKDKATTPHAEPILPLFSGS